MSQLEFIKARLQETGEVSPMELSFFKESVKEWKRIADKLKKEYPVVQNTKLKK